MNNSLSINQNNSSKSLTPEVIVPRVGYYLVETDEITEDDLKEENKHAEAFQKYIGPWLYQNL